MELANIEVIGKFEYIDGNGEPDEIECGMVITFKDKDSLKAAFKAGKCRISFGQDGAEAE